MKPEQIKSAKKAKQGKFEHKYFNLNWIQLLDSVREISKSDFKEIYVVPERYIDIVEILAYIYKVQLNKVLFLRDVEEIFQQGVKKHKGHDYTTTKLDKDYFINAYLRHLVAHEQGNIESSAISEHAILDKESKKPHLAHCFCNLIMLLETYYMQLGERK